MMKNVLIVVSFVLSQVAFAAEVQTETLPTASAVAAPATADANGGVTASKLPEDQIPLTIEASKKPVEGGSTTAKALMSVAIVLILTCTGYYFVRRYKFSNKINKSNTQIKVLSQHYLGPKKSLAIIHVAGESILVGVTDHNISMIKSLSLIDDEVPASLPNTFGQTLSNVEAGDGTQVAASKSAPAAKVSQAQVHTTTSVPVELDEEFSFTNVTETVSKKLRSMRSFS